MSETIEQQMVASELAGSAVGEWGTGVKTARTKQEKDLIHKYTIEQAMKGAFYGTLAGVGAHLALSRSWAAYARAHHTPKWIFILAWPITGFTILGEHSALDLERRIAARKSVVDFSNLEVKPAAPAADEKLSSFSWVPNSEEVKKYVLDNRYKVVGMAWLSVTSLTLVTLWANKNMPTAQKLIHARMYAQGTALASFIAFAFAANVPVDRSSEVDKVSEKYFRAVLEGRDVSGADVKRVTYDKPHKVTDGGVAVRGG